MTRPEPKAVIAALGLAVVVLTIGLLWAVLWRDPPRAAPAAEPAPAPARAEGSGQFGLSGHAAPGRDRPPRLARNELGQPLNEDGRPIGPPDKLARIRHRPVTSLDMPTTPPLFTDPEQRRLFKAWWVDELARRVEIFQRLEPRDDYPGAEQTRALLDDYYDAAEPRGTDEPVERAMERREAWRQLWRRFPDEYGATLKTISSRAGDPQHGQAPDPPVQPPGVNDADGPAAPEAEGAPPGRGADDPGGTEPIRQ